MSSTVCELLAGLQRPGLSTEQKRAVVSSIDDAILSAPDIAAAATVAYSAGAVTAMASLLDRESDALLLHCACSVLYRIASADASFIQAVADAGVFPLLVRVLENYTFPPLQFSAAQLTARTICGSGNRANAAASAGVVKPLVRLALRGDEQVQGAAIAALSNLCMGSTKRSKVIAASGVLELGVSLLSCGREETASSSCRMLANMLVAAINDKQELMPGAKQLVARAIPAAAQVRRVCVAELNVVNAARQVQSRGRLQSSPACAGP
jgi:hypothetical protein